VAGIFQRAGGEVEVEMTAWVRLKTKLFMRFDL
jgi:hypothetical protein